MILVTQLFGCPDNRVTGPQFGGLGIGKAKNCPGWRLDRPALDDRRVRDRQLTDRRLTGHGNSNIMSPLPPWSSPHPHRAHSREQKRAASAATRDNRLMPPPAAPLSKCDQLPEKLRASENRATRDRQSCISKQITSQPKRSEKAEFFPQYLSAERSREPDCVLLWLKNFAGSREPTCVNMKDFDGMPTTKSANAFNDLKRACSSRRMPTSSAMEKSNHVFRKESRYAETGRKTKNSSSISKSGVGNENEHHNHRDSFRYSSEINQNEVKETRRYDPHTPLCTPPVTHCDVREEESSSSINNPSSSSQVSSVTNTNEDLSGGWKSYLMKDGRRHENQQSCDYDRSDSQPLSPKARATSPSAEDTCAADYESDLYTPLAQEDRHHSEELPDEQNLNVYSWSKDESENAALESWGKRSNPENMMSFLVTAAFKQSSTRLIAIQDDNHRLHIKFRELLPHLKNYGLSDSFLTVFRYHLK
ncbi:unnamed protein product [Notodromas monacha]|uniref:Uncharacterized protein n=1 Tax=Notodromas monacha TaxID=399045 RepID=A0A7R9BLB1_9CRUS|nr:unnamed protein product [Notodromas monacha]CAG0916227.1 unnamed protein product [Notodromas monacha]